MVETVINGLESWEMPQITQQIIWNLKFYRAPKRAPAPMLLRLFDSPALELVLAMFTPTPPPSMYVKVLHFGMIYQLTSVSDSYMSRII